MQTIDVDPNDDNKLLIKKRCSIPDKFNHIWNQDYQNKTGNLPATGKEISRNHRISDKNIQTIIVRSVNENSTLELDNLINHAFPWSSREDEINAINLRDSLHSNITIQEKALIASELANYMAQYPNNISKGNGRQNSAIGKYLDLNAPKNAVGQHSFSPRSRRIAMAATYPNTGLFSVRCEGGKIMSSQYGSSGKHNKSAKNIDPNESSPETKRLSLSLMP